MGDQVVIVVLIECDGLIPVHRVEQADGVGLLVLLDGVGGLTQGVGGALGGDGAQGDQAGRDLPGEGLGVPAWCDGQLQIRQVGRSIDLVALHGAGKSVSSAVVACCGLDRVVSIEHGGSAHHLHIGAQLIGKGDEAALPAGARCALRGLSGGGGRLSGNVVCDLIKDLFPCLCVVDICYLVVRVVVGEAGDGGREVIKCNAVSTTCTSAISHDINAGVCFILVEIIIKIIGVRIGGELPLGVQAETGQVGGVCAARIYADGNKCPVVGVVIGDLSLYIGSGHHHGEGLGVAGFITARTISNYKFLDIITVSCWGSGDVGIAVLRLALREQDDLGRPVDLGPAHPNGGAGIEKLLCAQINTGLGVFIGAGTLPIDIKCIFNGICTAVDPISGYFAASSYGVGIIIKIVSLRPVLIVIQRQQHRGVIGISDHRDPVVGICGHQGADSGFCRGQHGFRFCIRVSHFWRHIQDQHGVDGHADPVHNGGRRAQAGQGHQKVGDSLFLHRVVRQPRYNGAGQCDILGGHGLVRPDASDVLGGQVGASAHTEQVLPVGVGGRVRDRSRVRVRRQGRAGQQAEQHTDRQQPAQRLSQFSHVAFLLFSSRTECSQPAQGGRCVQAPLTS